MSEQCRCQCTCHHVTQERPPKLGFTFSLFLVFVFALGMSQLEKGCSKSAEARPGVSVARP